MILVPELEIVVILVPRTGTSTLRLAVLGKYPKAIMLYRHMEADGVPVGYDRWPKVGVVRHPVERLWSLYKFLRDGLNGDQSRRSPSWVQAMRRSSAVPFEDWVTHNSEVFTSGYDYSGGSRYWPQQTVLHAMPENRKSQFVYLRPDLGTKVFKYTDLHLLGGLLGVNLTDRQNRTAPSQCPALSTEARNYAENVFAWDFGAMR